MPERVRAAGLAAIDKLEAHLLSVFDSLGGAAAPLDCAELDEFLSTLGLLEFKPRILTGAGYTTAGPFVADICTQLKLNPILVAFAAELVALQPDELAKNLPTAGQERNTEVRRAVVYCFVLQGTCRAIIEEPRRKKSADAPPSFLRQVADAFSTKRSQVKWKPYMNTFERMKVASVDFILRKRYIPAKQGELEETPVAGKGLQLSINILEAMYQDTVWGNDANAMAGFELMLEPCQRAPIAGLENALNYMDDARGLLVNVPSFPRVWANLYSSWNGAFCSNYPDAPFFLAKLFNPVTSGTYHEADKEGLYMHPRVMALWLHIHKEVFQRASLQAATPPGLKWHSPLLTLIWGQVNLGAARQFRARVDAAVQSLHGGVHPDRRDGLGQMFHRMQAVMVSEAQREYSLARGPTAAAEPGPASKVAEEAQGRLSELHRASLAELSATLAHEASHKTAEEADLEELEEEYAQIQHDAGDPLT